MSADDVVLLGLDLEAGMFLRDFSTAGSSAAVFNIAGVRRDGVEQRFTLIAVTLVAHVENLFELRVVREHAIVEMGGEFRAGLHQQGNGGFTVAMV